MSLLHHLSDETLQDYAAGSLTNAIETVAACHLTVCAACRERAALADMLGGAVLDRTDDTEPMLMSAAGLLALERTAAAGNTAKGHSVRVDLNPHGSDGSASADVTGGATTPVAGVPRPLGRLLPASLDELDWQRLAPGVKQYNLSDKHRRYGAFKLLHLAPGAVLSGHTHSDRELTYVVRGSYQDEIGRFIPGDIADLDGHDVHQPVVDTDEPCIALIASRSPAIYSGVLAKLIQPFVGI